MNRACRGKTLSNIAYDGTHDTPYAWLARNHSFNCIIWHASVEFATANQSLYDKTTWRTDAECSLSGTVLGDYNWIKREVLVLQRRLGGDALRRLVLEHFLRRATK